MKKKSYLFRNKNFSEFKFGKVIIIFFVIVSVIILFPHLFRNTYVVTIESKRIIKHDNKDTYLIYTEMQNGDIRVFKNDNSILEFKILSEDMYWGLIINKKYEIKAYGLSIPIFSSYQNIVTAKGVK
ncbi:DUF1523 family protein [Clostridium estertheticum]|uniref:DUF1523 family protein n=1 Tax=Clostridium estertheticum TaxID=238834 RepID=UPI001CF546DB|nr:DUF1523 family protein [Clostridium estertheticum]MCB2359938.1 DUF1523 family protein [Clostridium estertheticum]